MTFSAGYAMNRTDSLEELDMGGGSTLLLLVTGEESHGAVTVLSGTVHAGGPPLHVHDAEDEVVVVLEGRLDYQVGADRGVVDAGGVLWFPRQVPHAVANLSDEPCRFVTVATPSGIEDFFRAQRDYLRSLPVGAPPDPMALGGVAGAETRRVVGPPLARRA
jgi:quercetin dioxygenase-like cupin family protein